VSESSVLVVKGWKEGEGGRGGGKGEGELTMVFPKRA
jgi:hypothetical protein